MRGALPAEDGKYRCPHCDTVLILRSMKLHIQTCARLPDEQRRLLAARRQLRAVQRDLLRRRLSCSRLQLYKHLQLLLLSRLLNQWQKAELVLYVDARLSVDDDVGKQPAPEARQQPHVPRARNPLRQVSAQELPPPLPPAGWDQPKTCHFCLATFASREKKLKHIRCCRQMPYSVWLARVQETSSTVTVEDHKCPHCATPFWTARAKGRHSVVCRQRRLAEGLILSAQNDSEQALALRRHGPPAFLREVQANTAAQPRQSARSADALRRCSGPSAPRRAQQPATGPAPLLAVQRPGRQHAVE